MDVVLDGREIRAKRHEKACQEFAFAEQDLGNRSESLLDLLEQVLLREPVEQRKARGRCGALRAQGMNWTGAGPWAAARALSHSKATRAPRLKPTTAKGRSRRGATASPTAEESRPTSSQGASCSRLPRPGYSTAQTSTSGGRVIDQRRKATALPPAQGKQRIRDLAFGRGVHLLIQVAVSSMFVRMVFKGLAMIPN